MVLAAVLLPANLSAQEIMEPVDSVWADTVAIDNNDVDEVIEVVDSIYIGEDDLIVDSILTDSGELVADTFKLSDLEKWSSKRELLTECRRKQQTAKSKFSRRPDRKSVV